MTRSDCLEMLLNATFLLTLFSIVLYGAAALGVLPTVSELKEEFVKEKDTLFKAGASLTLTYLLGVIFLELEITAEMVLLWLLLGGVTATILYIRNADDWNYVIEHPPARTAGVFLVLLLSHGYLDQIDPSGAGWVLWEIASGLISGFAAEVASIIMIAMMYEGDPQSPNRPKSQRYMFVCDFLAIATAGLGTLVIVDCYYWSQTGLIFRLSGGIFLAWGAFQNFRTSSKHADPG